HVTVSGSYNINSGIVGQRTYLFRGLPQTSTLTVRLEPLGAEKGDVRTMTNLRFAREFKTSIGRFREQLDILNILNNASPWVISYPSGPTFGQYNTIDQPRIVHIGMSYNF